MLSRNHRTGPREPGPLVRSTAERLLRRIRRQHQPGDRLETIAAMARQLGVSLATMQKAAALLAGQGWLSSRPRAGTFVAAGPRRESGPIGLRASLPVAALRESEFYSGLFLGFCTMSLAAGMDVRLLAGSRNQYVVPEGWQELCGLVTLDILDPALLLPVAERLPVVMLETTATPPEISGVAFDYTPAIRQGVRHLIGLGHRRFGFVGHSYLSVGLELRCPRYQAFVQAVEDLGGEYDLHWSMDARRAPHARAAVERLLAAPRSQRPTAVVTRNMAWPLLSEMARRGLEPGKELSVLNLSSHEESWPRWLQCSRLLGDLMPWQYGQSDWLAGLPDVTGRLRDMVPTAVVSDPKALGMAAAEEVHRRRQDLHRPPRQHLIGVAFREGDTTGPAAC